jgi:sortase A
MASALTGGPSPLAGGDPVGRVETPDVAGAPEVVADPRAKAEQEAEKREAAERKAEEKEAAAKKKSEEEAKPPPPDDPTLYLTVPKLGVHGHTVRNDTSAWALDQGAVKIPETGFPWQEGANTYIAGHRIGYAGTESYYQFYNLPLMQEGDEVILEDANGTVYKYRVTEKFAVEPQDVWVTDPIPGRDIVTLQTCVEDVDPGTWWNISPKLLAAGPDTGRLIVRAERVE